MTDFSFNGPTLQRTAGDWDAVAEQVDVLVGALDALGSAGFGPRVVPAADGFATAWAGFARDSAEIARGLGTGLREIAADGARTDHSTATAIGDLESRLGQP